MASPTSSGAQATSEPSSTHPPDASASTTSEQEKGADEGVAANKVFDTVELLEIILLGVPMMHLFVLRRTSKTFRDTMRGSKKLKQHMFLELKPSETKEGNPVIQLFFQQDDYDRGVLMRGHLCQKNKTTVHFLRYWRSDAGQYFVERFSAAKIDKCCYVKMDQAFFDCSAPEHQVQRALSRKGRADEAWRDLMIAHTPAKRLRVNFINDELDSKSRRFKMGIENTLGAVFEWIVAYYEMQMV